MNKNMNEHEQEKRFLEKVRQTLDKSAESLDSRTLQRLQRIRQHAVEAGEKHRGFFELPRWVRAGALATTAVAAIVLFIWLSFPRPDFPAKHLEDLEIITAKEHIDLYKDLEFYHWLAAVENAS